MKNKISFRKALNLAKQKSNLDDVRLTKNTEYYLSEQKWIDLYVNFVAICREVYNYDTQQSTNIWKVKQNYMNRNSSGSLRSCLESTYYNINENTDIL